VFRDIDLYNQCLEGTDYSLVVPTDQTVKLFEEWVAKNWDINQENKRRLSSSESSSASNEDTGRLILALL
jgi:hypothetical protein